jgi:quinoprotein relay system zinc metallohydrolase 2
MVARQHLARRRRTLRGARLGVMRVMRVIRVMHAMPAMRALATLAFAATLCAGAVPAAHAAEGGAAGPAGAADALAVSQVAAGVFVHFGALQEWQPGNGGDVANLGFIVGSRCVAVIDTGGTPQVGGRLLAAVRRATPLPVCYVINTHAHPDHVLGNAAFAAMPAEPVAFVGHARLPAALAARERYFLNALQRDFGLTLPRGAVVYPDRLVDTSLDLDLGDRQLTLAAWPTAHTDHDLTVYDRRTRTLFASDLLFVEHLPVLDGNLRGWLNVMSSLAQLDVAVVVPGHGAAGSNWPAPLQAQRNYLNELLVKTRAALRDKKTITEAVSSIAAPSEATGSAGSAAPAWRLTEQFHRRNVTAAYAELEWED